MGINALYPKRKEKWERNPEYGFDKLLLRLCGVKVGRDFVTPLPALLPHRRVVRLYYCFLLLSGSSHSKANKPLLFSAGYMPRKIFKVDYTVSIRNL